MFTYEEFVAKLEEWYNAGKKIKVGCVYEILIFGKGACIVCLEDKRTERTIRNDFMYAQYKRGDFEFMENPMYEVYKKQVGCTFGGAVYYYHGISVKDKERNKYEVVLETIDEKQAKEYADRHNLENITLLNEQIEMCKQHINVLEEWKKEIMQQV